MKGKRILINASLITREPPGVGVYSHELLKRLVPILKREGFTFSIYCYDPEIIKEIDLTHVKKISLGVFLDKVLNTKKVIHRHIWTIILLNFLSINYDILYSFTSHGTLYHRNQIITIHDLICISFPNSYKSQYYYFKYFLPVLIKQSKRIVTISNFTADEIIKTYPINESKIAVISNGVDHLEKSEWSEDDEEWLKSVTEKMPFCITVGASYEHKNIETLLKVCAKMKHLKIKFLVINKPNPYYIFLQRKAQDFKLSNLIFLTYVSKNRLALLYKKARLNIYISLYEGFGFPPAEALFFGTQSLLSKQPALMEVYQESFEYCDPFDIQAIEKVVLKYVFAENKVENTGYEKLKQKYNWTKSAEGIVNLFKSQLY